MHTNLMDVHVYYMYIAIIVHFKLYRDIAITGITLMMIFFGIPKPGKSLGNLMINTLVFNFF